VRRRNGDRAVEQAASAKARPRRGSLRPGTYGGRAVDVGVGARGELREEHIRMREKGEKMSRRK
jgi:hypothetical protein